MTGLSAKRPACGSSRTQSEGGARERVNEKKRLRRKLEPAFLDAYPEFKQERPSPVGVQRPLRFQALGGGNEVGRSAYLIGIGSIDVLVDCGIAVGARDRESEVPDLSALDRLDALLVTHAHTDHVGWIPALVAAIDYFPIYCTAPTTAMLPVMLRGLKEPLYACTSQREPKAQVRSNGDSGERGVHSRPHPRDRNANLGSACG